jgi:hypothetical protein
VLRQLSTHDGRSLGLLRSRKLTFAGFAHSLYNADFAGLNDLREIALAEVQICPDDGGWVAVGRIEQTDGPLGQRVLRQQWHQALLPDGRGRQKGRQLRYYIATERTAAQVMIVVGKLGSDSN